jgi:hypothetical protein
LPFFLVAFSANYLLYTYHNSWPFLI